jgi:cytoskeletal protein RodZ
MGSFGERLRREREMRGITIEEIAEATKIGSRNLRALEDEKFDLLPGGIFNKGFVRAYSKFLGLDEEQAVADYIAAESSFRDAASDGLDVQVEAVRRSLVLPITIVLLLVIAGGGYGGWRYYQKRAAQREAESAVARQPAPVAPISQTVAASQPPASQDSSASATTQPANSPTVTPAATASPASSAPETAAASTSASADGFVVQLKANQASWVSAKADGKSVFSDTLKAANEKTLHARDRIVLTLGNAAGVQVSYNGKDQTFDRVAGKVKILVFTAQGLQPDAPEQR